MTEDELKAAKSAELRREGERLGDERDDLLDTAASRELARLRTSDERVRRMDDRARLLGAHVGVATPPEPEEPEEPRPLPNPHPEFEHLLDQLYTEDQLGALTMAELQYIAEYGYQINPADYPGRRELTQRILLMQSRWCRDNDVTDPNEAVDEEPEEPHHRRNMKRWIIWGAIAVLVGIILAGIYSVAAFGFNVGEGTFLRNPAWIFVLFLIGVAIVMLTAWATAPEDNNEGHS
jgi:hypothetical protein